MGFRVTRHSNDKVAWLALALSCPAFAGVLFLAPAMFLRGNEWLTRGIGAFIFVVITACFIQCLRGLIWPWEYELSVEDGVIRFGRKDKPRRQSSFDISRVRYLWISTGDGRQIYLGSGRALLTDISFYLQEPADEKAFFDYLNTHYPQIKIHEGWKHPGTTNP